MAYWHAMLWTHHSLGPLCQNYHLNQKTSPMSLLDFQQLFHLHHLGVQ